MKIYLRIALTVFVVLFLFIIIKNYVVRRDYFGETYCLERLISSFLKQEGITPKYITEENYTQKQSGNLKIGYIEKRYRLGDNVNLENLIDKLKKEVIRNDYSVLKKRFSSSGTDTVASLEFGKNKIALFYLEIRTVEERKVSVGVRKGKIALVLDDWGYNMRNWQALSRIKEPLTISVLPDLPYSTKIATSAQAEGYEVILHLPLESYEHKNMERNTIYSDMEGDEIKSILEGGFLSVPKAVGVSNHMGSRSTEDGRVMKIIFEVIKEKDIFFLDSLVTEKSLCENLAKETEIKFTERDVFLDNVSDKNYIRKQLMELVRLAYSSSRPVVGIGHDRLLTLEVLEEEIGHLAEQGIEFVYLSEAVK